MITQGIKNLIELLLLYKNSMFYSIHIIILITITTLLFAVFGKVHEIKKKDQQPRQTNFTEKRKYIDYISNIKRNTQVEVRKLQQSQQFKKFIKKRDAGFYKNKRNDDISDIELSDDSDQQYNKKRI